VPAELLAFVVALARYYDAPLGEALKLAGIDSAASYLRQGEQLIRNFGHAVWCIGSLLFGDQEKSGG
jgi:hypothetical protein